MQLISVVDYVGRSPMCLWCIQMPSSTVCPAAGQIIEQQTQGNLYGESSYYGDHYEGEENSSPMQDSPLLGSELHTTGPMQMAEVK